MRYQGKLKKWNAERGFGFVVADDGGQDIFVHASAFPRDGVPPAEGETLSFEIEPDRDGKKKAVRVRRPGAQAPLRNHQSTYTPADTPTHRPTHTRSPSQASRMSRTPKGAGFGSKLITLGLLAALGWYGYNHFAARTAHLRAGEVMPAAELTSPTPSTFRCDGRTHCSQMTSCTEAKLFLKNCPGVMMDGNNDGVPCEQQWCTSPMAR